IWIESQLTISPFSRSPSSKASADFPDAVGPTMATSDSSSEQPVVGAGMKPTPTRADGTAGPRAGAASRSVTAMNREVGLAKVGTSAKSFIADFNLAVAKGDSESRLLPLAQNLLLPTRF